MGQAGRECTSFLFPTHQVELGDLATRETVPPRKRETLWWTTSQDLSHEV